MISDDRRTTTGLRELAVAMLLVALAACASQAPEGPLQYLDQHSAATVTVGSGALVFARERPELAVHARDYLTVVPLDVNRGGTHRLYLYCYVWSTIDKRAPSGTGAAPVRFELNADGRPIPLSPVEAEARELGLVQPPVRAPSPAAQLLIVATDRETLDLLANANEIHVVAQHGSTRDHYGLWKGEARSLLTML